ncbi:ABC transporter permease [Deferribacter autotrophicus]|uniref:ABC transporter permease n=1 Tax=Deferribacter autotrophicus TaxID=500465 RepID=A0A5A8F975_9BACT|nr:ABC transporter permease [Deferribacter autotrophicus]KAA0259552.1 ABC transporter permease [Deferribacter autotrophicus]
MMVEILLDATIRAGTSILYATLGEILTERSGIINLGVEGLMLIGALSGFYVSHITGNLYLGVLAAFILAALAGMIHGFITVYLRANQIVSGLALTMFGIGVTALFGKKMIGIPLNGFQKIEVPVLAKIPIIGVFFNQDILVYFSYITVVILSFILFKTKFGLKIRMVGENPGAADTAGINVYKIRFFSTVFGSGLSGIGGAYLSLAYTPLWIENMSAGRGWIAVALVIFASWYCYRAMFGAYLFGGINALQLRLQAMGTNVSAHILQMLPYFFTIIVLVIATIRLEKGARVEPEGLGLPYDREDRR